MPVALPRKLFERLSRLNRKRLQETPPSGPDSASPRAGPPQIDAGPGAASLAQVIPGEERRAAGASLYVVRRRAGELVSRRAPRQADDEAGADDLLGRYERVFHGAGLAVAPEDLHETLRPLVLTDPAAITYLDIETCGLAGEPIFLVGLLRYRDRELLIEQFLARDYSEERAVLAAAWEVLADTACLVTFNGKTFDMPTVGARSLACGVFDCPAMPEHVDLLFEARRRWRRVLPNCRLQTIEQFICGRRRAGDIPGHEIPAAYHEFVRACRGQDGGRRARSLRCLQTILHHNALDLLTMADLVTRILAGFD